MKIIKIKKTIYKIILSSILLHSPLFAQEYLDKFLHYDWRQSITTHETARVLDEDQFALTFAVNNYFLAWSRDIHAHDLLLFDIVARYGVFEDFEVALKYSYPNSALIRAKYKLVDELFGQPIGIAAELGISNYKLSTQTYKTDYILDLYPGIIFDYKIYKTFKFYFLPKFIYSWYVADRWARTEDPPRKPWSSQTNMHYGYCWGFSLGSKTMFTIEDTWHWVQFESIKYKIHMQGISVTRIID